MSVSSCSKDGYDFPFKLIVKLERKYSYPIIMNNVKIDDEY